MELFNRIDIQNIDVVRTQQPHNLISAVLEGYTETINQFTWMVSANTSPFNGWRVGLVGTDVEPSSFYTLRAEPDSAVVTSGCAAGGTSITVTTTGPRWITTADHPNDFPMYLDIGGTVVQCTGITGTGQPQTFTLTGGTVKYAIGSGFPVQIAWPGFVGQEAT